MSTHKKNDDSTLLNAAHLISLSNDASLAVAYDDPQYSNQALALSYQLGLPAFMLKQSIKYETQHNYLLLLRGGKVSIAKTGKSAPNPVCVDFVSGAVAHRRLYGGGKGQDIAKAVGLNKRKQVRVLDATAGLGRDAFVLATLGAEVVLLERVPFVKALLEDGLRRASLDPDVSDIIERMVLGDYLINQVPAARFDVVYLDPMFPHSEKSAAVKKEMAFFRDLVGHDEDADTLLPNALRIAEYRVVVKRPKQAPFLNKHSPTYSLEGKSGRFDVYVNKSLEI